MTVLVDTDVLLDIALDREPWGEDSTEFLEFCQRHAVDTYVAWHTFSNLYYVARKVDEQEARHFVGELLGFIRIAPVGTEDMLFALDQPVADLEDAMQVAAAVVCRARHIVTRNTRHFKKSAIPAITPKAFLAEVPS